MVTRLSTNFREAAELQTAPLVNPGPSAVLVKARLSGFFTLESCGEGGSSRVIITRLSTNLEEVKLHMAPLIEPGPSEVLVNAR